jgi:hypothetical protein
MKRVLTTMLLALSISLAGHMSWAANLDNPISGVYKGATGDTITVEVPSNVSKSPDNLPGDLDFQVTSNTGYRDFAQLTDIKTGDPVTVEYNVDQRTKRMVATMISRSDSQTTKTTTTTTTSSTTEPVTTTANSAY